MTIRPLLQRCVEGRTRLWAVIIPILGIGLAVILPAADKNSELRRHQAEWKAKVAKIRHEVAELDDVRRAAEQRQAKLDAWRSRAVSVENVHAFRQQVVALARDSGCQIRRMNVGAAQSKPWMDGDDPLGQTKRKRRTKKPPTHAIQTQSMSMTVSGDLQGVRKMLTQLDAAERMIHTKSFTLNPSREDQGGVVLDLELLLFGLTAVNKPG